MPGVFQLAFSRRRPIAGGFTGGLSSSTQESMQMDSRRGSAPQMRPESSQHLCLPPSVRYAGKTAHQSQKTSRSFFAGGGSSPSPWLAAPTSGAVTVVTVVTVVTLAG